MNVGSTILKHCNTLQNHKIVVAIIYSLAGGTGFVVDVVPNNPVILTNGDWASNGEDEPAIECLLQQLTDFPAFVVVRQVCKSTSAVVWRTWIGMSSLHQPRNNTCVEMMAMMQTDFTDEKGYRILYSNSI